MPETISIPRFPCPSPFCSIPSCQMTIDCLTESSRIFTSSGCKMRMEIPRIKSPIEIPNQI